jgi:PhnB protein
MAQLLNPYLNFDGNAREAMEFYRDALGGELEVNTFGEYGGTPADGVMHSYLGTPAGFHLMASDLPEGQAHDPGTNITISLSGDDAEALGGYFAKLAEGGTVSMPLEKQMWGDTFGMLIDKFGIHWMVNIQTGEAG